MESIAGAKRKYATPLVRVVVVAPEERLMVCAKVGPPNGECDTKPGWDSQQS